MAITDPDDVWIERNQPPWIVFPSLPADIFPTYLTQGETEWWFDEIWRPFWTSLSREQKERYLTFWKATDAWRSVLEALVAAPDFDLEEDARESEEYLEELRRARAKERQNLPFWKRWFARR